MARLSIDVDTLVDIWAKNMSQEPGDFEANGCRIMHPHGWWFCLGKFRDRPCPGEPHRVRMFLRAQVGTEFRDLSDFIHLFLGIDLDDCHLEHLTPLLEWCQKHNVGDLVRSIHRFEKSKVVHNLMVEDFDLAEQKPGGN